VRENGGQYTHAAVWASMAFAELGEGARAWELLSMINPLNHSRTEEAVDVYKAEPYVVAADVYAVAPHTGRGGWTWYTGSAGWFYRLIVESLLGLRRQGDRLRIAPCMPREWKHYSLSYRYADTFYRIAVERSFVANEPLIRATLDGTDLADPEIPLVDDRREHIVVFRVNQLT
jgi:cyclic beta-1,2-glucan synthetase